MTILREKEHIFTKMVTSLKVIGKMVKRMGMEDFTEKMGEEL